LAAIGNALDEINADGVKMTLDIYTQEKPTKAQLKALSPNDYLRINGSVKSDELVQIYKKADIALHVVSFDTKYRYATRVSFSTKIVDLMASSCAIMAICWEKHAGYQYLKKHDAAFCVSEYTGIKPELKRICENPELIKDYSQKAWDCGMQNHRKEQIQIQLWNVFETVRNGK
jgi:hypothetical protein